VTDATVETRPDGGTTLEGSVRVVFATVPRRAGCSRPS